MPIINGKKRYVPEEIPKPIVEKKRHETPKQQPVPVKKKHYIKGQGVKSLSSTFVGVYEFDVRINLIQVSFSKVINLENRIETEMFVEGGNNDYPIVRQKSKQEAEIVIFEKGIANNIGGSIFSAFREGMILTNILIIVKKNGKIICMYGIDQGLIISKKFSDLDANSSSVLIEKLELAHTGLHQILLP